MFEGLPADSLPTALAGLLPGAGGFPSGLAGVLAGVADQRVAVWTLERPGAVAVALATEVRDRVAATAFRTPHHHHHENDDKFERPPPNSGDTARRTGGHERPVSRSRGTTDVGTG